MITQNLRTSGGTVRAGRGPGPRSGLRATVRAQLAAHVANVRADRVTDMDSSRAISGADKLVGR